MSSCCLLPPLSTSTTVSFWLIPPSLYPYWRNTWMVPYIKSKYIVGKLALSRLKWWFWNVTNFHNEEILNILKVRNPITVNELLTIKSQQFIFPHKIVSLILNGCIWNLDLFFLICWHSLLICGRHQAGDILLSVLPPQTKCPPT